MGELGNLGLERLVTNVGNSGASGNYSVITDSIASAVKYVMFYLCVGFLVSLLVIV